MGIHHAAGIAGIIPRIVIDLVQGAADAGHHQFPGIVNDGETAWIKVCILACQRAVGNGARSSLANVRFIRRRGGIAGRRRALRHSVIALRIIRHEDDLPVHPVHMHGVDVFARPVKVRHFHAAHAVLVHPFCHKRQFFRIKRRISLAERIFANRFHFIIGHFTLLGLFALLLIFFDGTGAAHLAVFQMHGCGVVHFTLFIQEFELVFVAARRIIPGHGIGVRSKGLVLFLQRLNGVFQRLCTGDIAVVGIVMEAVVAHRAQHGARHCMDAHGKTVVFALKVSDIIKLQIAGRALAVGFGTHKLSRIKIGVLLLQRLFRQHGQVFQRHLLPGILLALLMVFIRVVGKTQQQFLIKRITPHFITVFIGIGHMGITPGIQRHMHLGAGRQRGMNFRQRGTVHKQAHPVRTRIGNAGRKGSHVVFIFVLFKLGTDIQLRGQHPALQIFPIPYTRPVLPVLLVVFLQHDERFIRVPLYRLLNHVHLAAGIDIKFQRAVHTFCSQVISHIVIKGAVLPFGPAFAGQLHILHHHPAHIGADVDKTPGKPHLLHLYLRTCRQRAQHERLRIRLHVHGLFALHGVRFQNQHILHRRRAAFLVRRLVRLLNAAAEDISFIAAAPLIFKGYKTPHTVLFQNGQQRILLHRFDNRGQTVLFSAHNRGIGSGIGFFCIRILLGQIVVPCTQEFTLHIAGGVFPRHLRPAVFQMLPHRDPVAVWNILLHLIAGTGPFAQVQPAAGGYDQHAFGNSGHGKRAEQHDCRQHQSNCLLHIRHLLFGTERKRFRPLYITTLLHIRQCVRAIVYICPCKNTLSPFGEKRVEYAYFSYCMP